MKLFIDDLRFPVDDSWVIVRSSHEALEYIEANGCPDIISFDHDLGGDDTSMVFLHRFLDLDMDGIINIPTGFTYHIHSANPVGVKNIDGLLSGYLKHKFKAERGSQPQP